MPRSIRNSICSTLLFLTTTVMAVDAPATRTISNLTKQYCTECHNPSNEAERLDFTSLTLDFDNPVVFNQWEDIFDKVTSMQMPPDQEDMPTTARHDFTKLLGRTLQRSDRQQIEKYGRGTIRRLTRSEFQQNLRDLLHIPHLDIQDYLPEDRESHHTNRITTTLDISRVQLAAYLEASDVALRQAIASGTQPRTPVKRRFAGVNLFSGGSTFGGPEAMFYA